MNLIGIENRVKLLGNSIQEIKEVVSQISRHILLKPTVTLKDLMDYLSEFKYNRRLFTKKGTYHDVKEDITSYESGYSTKLDTMYISFSVRGERARSVILNPLIGDNNPLLKDILHYEDNLFSNPFSISMHEFPCLIKFLEKFTITEGSKTFETILELEKLCDELLRIKEERVISKEPHKDDYLNLFLTNSDLKIKETKEIIKKLKRK